MGLNLDPNLMPSSKLDCDCNQRMKQGEGPPGCGVKPSQHPCPSIERETPRFSNDTRYMLSIAPISKPADHPPHWTYLASIHLLIMDYPANHNSDLFGYSPELV